MICRRHPILCIVPPHILKEVTQKGTDRQKEWAWRTLTMSEQVRGQRQALGTIAALGVTPVGQKRRTVYDAEHGDVLPGRLVRAEGDGPTGDSAVDEAFDGAGVTYDLYDQEFGRNSIDDLGLRLDSTVHYLEGYDNAFWTGAQMVYGDGDEDLPEEERLWNRFTIAVDVIGHELTHGVTQYEANLAYRSQIRRRERVYLRRVRLPGQTADPRADGGPGGLADRGGSFHLQRERGRHTVHEGAGHGL